MSVGPLQAGHMGHDLEVVVESERGEFLTLNLERLDGGLDLLASD